MLRLVLAWVRELWCLGQWAGIPTIGQAPPWASRALGSVGLLVAGLGWKVQYTIEGLCFPPSLVHTSLWGGVSLY